MVNYYLMNRVLIEDGTMERSLLESDSYVDHLIDVSIKDAEDNSALLDSLGGL